MNVYVESSSELTPLFLCDELKNGYAETGQDVVILDSKKLKASLDSGIAFKDLPEFKNLYLKDTVVLIAGLAESFALGNANLPKDNAKAFDRLMDEHPDLCYDFIFRFDPTELNSKQNTLAEFGDLLKEISGIVLSCGKPPYDVEAPTLDSMVKTVIRVVSHHFSRIRNGFF